MTGKYRKNRKNLQPKTVRIGVLEAQATKNRYLIEQLENNFTEMKIDIGKIKKKIGLVEKTKCPHCGKEFKDIKRHKCKLKPVAEKAKDA